MLLSVIIPVYNEQEVLPILLQQLPAALARISDIYEIIFVNDGSADNSLNILRQAASADARLRIVSFSRNFGHQVAITAGLDFAQGDAVVIMDADLQDPPELLVEMVQAYEDGYDVVSAQRVSRKTDTMFKRNTAALFYWFLQTMVDKRIQPEVGDFRLLSRGAVEAVRRFREQHRFMRGLIAWLGLKEKLVPFERQRRAAGETKYPLRKMIWFAWTAIVSFSALPLRISTWAGVALAAAGFVYLAYVLYAAIVLNAVVPGWTSIIVIQCFFSGITLIFLGLIGDYLAKVFEEQKRRPLYVVGETCNITGDGSVMERAIVLRERPNVTKRVNSNG